MAESTDLVRANGGSLAGTGEHGMTQGNAMGGEIARSAETGTQALEAQARAVVQARFFLAKQPNMQRSWDTLEQKLRRECQRPGFANAAWYVLPLGNDPRKYPAGFSIRFAEAALRMAGNIDVQQQTVYDDAWKRIVRVTVLDLESNFAYTAEATIDKTVERRDSRGREVLTVRQNSEGKMTYVVAATEQELMLKTNSAVSKIIRTQGLRMIPGDILEECKASVLATREKGAKAEDPELARKTILDNFAELGVLPVDLARYLEHDTNIFQPAERDLLRGIYRAIRDGHCTWNEVMEAKFGTEEGKQESEGAQRLRSMLAKRGAPQQQQAPPEPTTAASEPAKPVSSPSPAPVPAADQPPTNLKDYPNWDDADLGGAWVKVQGVIYQINQETGAARKWEPQPQPDKDGRLFNMEQGAAGPYAAEDGKRGRKK